MAIEGLEGLEGLVGTELIQDTFLFQLLNFDETLAMAGLFQKQSKASGETIIEEGSLGQALYIVESGRVKVVKSEGDCVEELAVLGRGELFGEMSLIENELTSASVMAEDDVVLLMIKRNEFENLLAQHPNIALKVYKTFCLTLSDRLRHTSEELSQLKAKLDPAGKSKTGKGAAFPESKSKKFHPDKSRSGKKRAKK